MYKHFTYRDHKIVSEMAPPSKPHVMIFPFMAHGHTLPLLDLSKALSSQNIKVTIVTTPSNAKSILKTIPNNTIHSNNIHLSELPFPTNVNGIPNGCENTSQLPSMDLHPAFVLATKHLQTPFAQLLQRMKEFRDLPLCVISDFFLGFTLKVCEDFGIPRLVFHGMGALSMAICKASWVHKPRLTAKSISDPIDLPGIKLPFVLSVSDLPDDVNNSSDVDNPTSRLLEEIGAADVNSWGVIVNTFVDLEMGQVSAFESFYREGARAWCVGPLNLYNDVHHVQNQSFDYAMKWLDDHDELSRSASVLYVSFGTQANVSDAQLDEVAYGLEESGVSFIWVVRSNTWIPPNDIKEIINDKGLIVSGWADQRRILSHNLIGGFLSHCGWNSVLESISAGVPILAWPMIAEQMLNAKLVVEGLGAGIRVRKTSGMGSANIVVSRQAICKRVRELMGSGEKGKRVREKAKSLGAVAKRSVEEGGSSFQTLHELIQKLRG